MRRAHPLSVLLSALLAAPLAHAPAQTRVREAPDPAYDLPPLPPQPTDGDIATVARGYLKELAAHDRFSGAVLLARQDRPLLLEAYGQACKRYGVPNRPTTRFNMGSANKMFTAVAVAQLAQQGKLSFQDPVAKHLPDYPNAEVARRVTLHDLLTHSSGLGSYWNERYEANWRNLRATKDLLSLFAEEPLAFAPGERFQYSNSGFVVLGLVVERLSGLSYDEYLARHVFAPAGMTGSGCFAMDDEVPDLALGYTRAGLDGRPSPDGPLRNNLFLHSVKGGPAGGCYSTAEDLLRFSRALLEHRLLSPELTRTVTEGKVVMGPGARYAYGFGDHRVAGHRFVGHNGGGPGISADVRIFPELDTTLVVLSNYDRVAAPVTRALTELVVRAAG